MFILPSVDPDGAGDLVISASDIISADDCGFAAVRKLEAAHPQAAAYSPGAIL